MAFFRIDTDASHSLEECANSKCKDCEIPVIFRYNGNWPTPHGVIYRNNKPNLKKGDKVLLEGKFASSEYSERPSFTAYSYQIIQ